MLPLESKVAGFFGRVPVPRLRSRIESTPAWCLATGCPLIECPLEPPAALQEPQGCDDALASRLRALSADVEPHPRFVATIPQCFVVGGHGFVVTPGGDLLADVSVFPREDPRATHPAAAFSPRLGLATWARRLPGTFATLTSLWSRNNYYHWLIDCIPRLQLLRNTLPACVSLDGVVLPTLTMPAQDEMLSLLGVNAGQRVHVDRRGAFLANSLVVTSLAAPIGRPSPSVCRLIRQAFAPIMARARATVSSPRVLIQRHASRRATNAPELAALAARHGFQPVDPSAMSFTEQVAMMANAQAVIGTHGAGLANLVFADPGTRVLEIFSPHYVNACFRILCAAGHLEHAFVQAAPSSDETKGAQRADPKTLDITVPLDAVERWMDSLGPIRTPRSLG